MSDPFAPSSDPDIPTPTRNDLLPLVYGGTERALLAAGKLDATHAENLWRGARREWDEGHKRDAERRREEEANQPSQSGIDVPTPDRWLPQSGTTSPKEALANRIIKIPQPSEVDSETIRSDGFTDAEVADSFKRLYEPRTSNVVLGSNATPETNPSPTMARFRADVKNYREALGVILRSSWGWVPILFICGLLFNFGYGAMTEGKYPLAIVLYLIGIGLVAAKAIYDFRSHQRRKQITTLIVIFAIIGLAVLTGWTEWNRRQQKNQNKTPSPHLTIDQLLKHEAGMTDFLYPTGTLVGGIAWQRNFVEVRLVIITGPLPIQNLDMHIELDGGTGERVGVADAKETTGIPCTFLGEAAPGVPTLGRDQLFGEVERDKSGNRVRKPASVAQIISPIYRMQCAYVQRNSVLKLIVAAASAKGLDGPREFPSTITSFGTFETNGPNGIQLHEFTGTDKLEIGK